MVSAIFAPAFLAPSTSIGSPLNTDVNIDAMQAAPANAASRPPATVMLGATVGPRGSGVYRGHASEYSLNGGLFVKVLRARARCLKNSHAISSGASNGNPFRVWHRNWPVWWGQVVPSLRSAGSGFAYRNALLII